MEHIKKLFQKRKRVKNAKDKEALPMPPAGKEIFTVEETAAFTGHTVSYVHKLCSTRMIPHYNPEDGRKVYFSRQEIIAWCTAVKVKTKKEILNDK